MFWNNGGTFCNLLSGAPCSVFSLFEEQEQALLAYCHFHSFLIFPKTPHCPWKQCTRRFGITGYSVHHKIQSQVQTNHALYSCVISHWVYQIYKEGGVLNRFSNPRRHFSNTLVRTNSLYGKRTVHFSSLTSARALCTCVSLALL